MLPVGEMGELMRLEVDITPSLVNRTAVYRMVQDVCSDWLQLNQKDSKFELFFNAVGFRLSGLSGQARKRRVLLRLFQLAVRRPVLFLAGREVLLRVVGILKRNRRPTKRFFFDPLYVLFNPDRVLDQACVIVHDLTPITHPGWHSPGVGLLYRAAFQKIVQSKAKLICDSQSTADDLRVNYGISGSQYQVVPIYLPVSDESAPTQSETHRREDVERILQKKYLLFVGSLEHRKNIVGLIDGFAVSRLAQDGFLLVIVGGRGSGSEHIIQRARTEESVKLLGYVDDHSLELLYRSAAGFAYPSYWEGFGVPLLEAMARGIPCVSTETGASPEVGQDAVIYVDPTSVTSIAYGLRKLVELPPEERHRMIELGRKRASEFTLPRYLQSLRRFCDEKVSPPS
jgi:glycosyltransferase involved in cell wall biosynthesis